MPNTQAHDLSNTSTSTAGLSSGPNGVAPSLSSGGDANGDASVEATTRSSEARPTARPTVAFDAEYSPEIVEYFARRYQDVKAELDRLKHQLSTQPDRDALRLELQGLKASLAQLEVETMKQRSTEQTLRDIISKEQKEVEKLKAKAEILEKAQEEGAAKLLQMERTNASMKTQIQNFYSQARALADEAAASRRKFLTGMFPDPISYFDPNTMDYSPLTFDISLANAVVKKLPPYDPDGNIRPTLFFLPRPPACLPLHVAACGQHGYWFQPDFKLKADRTFELMVEGEAGKWYYLGRFITDVMKGQDMRLSEWLMLDESTKLMHCMRYASVDLPLYQLASHPALIEIKRRFECGELLVPCYSLFCIGYSAWLYDAMKEIIAQLPGSTTPQDSTSGSRATVQISNETAAVAEIYSQPEMGPGSTSTPSISGTDAHTTDFSGVDVSGRAARSNSDTGPVLVPCKRVNADATTTVSNGTNGAAQGQQGPGGKRSRNASGGPDVARLSGDGVGTAAVNPVDLTKE